MTTYTSQVLSCLVSADDFMTLHQINEAVGSPGIQRVSAALHHLFKYHAVDCVEGERALWWFATPGEDRRTFVRRKVEFSERLRKSHPHPRRRLLERPKRI